MITDLRVAPGAILWPMRRSLGYLVLLSAATASAAPDPEPPTPAPSPSPSSVVEPPVLPSTAPGTQPVSPLRALPARVEEAPPILVPLAVGTIFGAAGIYFGGKLGIAAADEQSLTSVFVIGLGGLVGGTVAVTVGVMATAGDDVHQSSTAATWGGSVIGGVAGVAFAVAATNDLTSAIFVTAGGSALGALIGHQLSRTRRNPPPTLRLAPLVTTHATGLAVGGHF